MISILPAGASAIVAEYDDLQAVMAHFAALDTTRIPGVIDLVPAARTILVQYDTTITGRQRIEAWVRSRVPADAAAEENPAALVVPVRYDGADLAEVGELTGLGADGVVDAHTAATWTVAFIGFAPGFAYLAGSDERLTVPRRPAPRTSVPAGAVGLAARFSGIYPRSSPGGWQLIGTTDLAVWDAGRRPPALLMPGTAVRFVRV